MKQKEEKKKDVLGKEQLHWCAVAVVWKEQTDTNITSVVDVDVVWW